MINRILAVALVATLAACSKDPIAVTATDNGAIKVDKLFTHSGITVFRFTDGGRAVYFTSQASNIKSVGTEGCGKNCTRSVTVETLGR